jgi:hypothetical protein
MSTYTISSIKENRIYLPFMDSNKKEDYNVKKINSIKQAVLLKNSSYVITNNVSPEVKHNLSLSQSS